MTKGNPGAVVGARAGRHRAGLPPPLPASFFEPDVLSLARALIGKVLLTSADGGWVGVRIVETEAYRGPEDQAAHSRNGLRTARTEAMFGPPGHVYMFVVYGRHWAFNVTAGAPGEPHAVLVRAAEPTAIGGERLLATGARRPTSGPGRLCRALGLGKAHYGLPLAPTSGVYLADGPRGEVGASRRIRVDYAGAWAEKPWRFFERGNRWVSERPRD